MIQAATIEGRQPKSEEIGGRSARPGRRRLGRWLDSLTVFALRCIVLMLGLVFRTGHLYRILGIVNRHSRTIRTVFFCYAGSTYYARRYCFRWSERWLIDTPTPIGVYRQGGHWGLILASPISERQIVDPNRAERLNQLLQRVDSVAGAIGAERVRLAGVLPGHLRRQGYSAGRDDRELVARVIRGAVARAQERLPTDVPIVLLGGQGYVGRALQRALRRSGRSFHVVDRLSENRSIPQALQARPVLLVDVSRRGALDGHVAHLYPGSVVINENFPEPDRRLVARLRNRGCSVLHIAGVQARVYPSLPGGYRDAVPCCAVHCDGSVKPVLLSLGG